MVLTLPLSMFALTPGLKLTPFLAAIPVSGLSLILQNLLAVSGEPVSVLELAARRWFAGGLRRGAGAGTWAVRGSSGRGECGAVPRWPRGRARAWAGPRWTNA